jgi:hypothetical protein
VLQKLSNKQSTANIFSTEHFKLCSFLKSIGITVFAANYMFLQHLNKILVFFY